MNYCNANPAFTDQQGECVCGLPVTAKGLIAFSNVSENKIVRVVFINDAPTKSCV
jgi:hypothetical protein